MNPGTIDNGSYFNSDEFAVMLSRSEFNFHVFHFNIRSYNKNSDELCVFLEQLASRPDVIVLTETWFTEDTVSDIAGFTAYHVYRIDRRGGGVSIFVKNEYNSSSVTHLSYVGENIEICAIDVHLSQTCLRICGIYRPPDRNIRMFTDIISDMLTTTRPSDHVMLVGDLNIDLVNPTLHEEEFITLCSAVSFVPLITAPTHVSGDSYSCLDHIWLNQLMECRSGIFPVDITDHYPVFVSMNIQRDVVGTYSKTFRDHSRESLEALRCDFSRVVYDFDQRFAEYGGNIDWLTQHFCNEIYTAYNACCPIRTKCISLRRYLKPWITNDVMKCIKRKHDLFLEYKNDFVDFEYYNSYKNLITKLLRRVKARYYAAVFADKSGDPAGTWRVVNSLVNRKGCKRPTLHLSHNDVLLTNPVDVAECFNDYFSGIAGELNDRIPPANSSPMTYMGERVSSSFFINPVAVSEVKSIVDGLKSKSCNLYSVPTFILKYFSNILSPIICKLFNLSVQTGIFPNNLKIAKVTPIFKSGDCTLASNYRPISNLSDLSKIFEKCMHSKVLSYITSNNIINRQQFGFQHNSCTSDAILEYLDGVYRELNRKRSIMSVFLDFSKAFDTVRHDILQQKLEHLGIRGLALDWFRSYLSNRQQYVSVNNCKSSNSLMEMGVPQGSVLGPVLFLIYINDMSNCSDKLNFVHFADDTTVFCSGDNVIDIANEVNVELSYVNEWLKSNRLSLNILKTNFMIISDSKLPVVPDIQIEGVSVLQKSEANFLGVKIDDRLTFRNHVSCVAKSVSRSIGMLRRISDLVPPRIRKCIYYSLIYSKVSYGVVAWGSSSLSNRSRMNGLLRRARKCVAYGAGPGFAEDLLDFDSIFKYFVGIKLFKVIRLEQHPYFSLSLSSLQPEHNYGTRFSVGSNYNTPQFVKTKCQNSFIFRSVELWNALPDDIRVEQSLVIYKRRLKLYLLNIQMCN